MDFFKDLQLNISVYIGNKYLKLTSFLAIDRKEGKITKFVNRIFGSVGKKRNIWMGKYSKCKC